jgi:hypothetical protein
VSQSCFGVGVLPSDVTATNIQQMAAQNSWGIVPDSSNFTVDCPNSVTAGCASSSNKCGTNPGYLVTVTYPYNLINYIFTPLTLTAKSCFPINVS